MLLKRLCSEAKSLRIICSCIPTPPILADMWDSITCVLPIIKLDNKSTRTRDVRWKATHRGIRWRSKPLLPSVHTSGTSTAIEAFWHPERDVLISWCQFCCCNFVYFVKITIPTPTLLALFGYLSPKWGVWVFRSAIYQEILEESCGAKVRGHLCRRAPRIEKSRKVCK